MRNITWAVLVAGSWLLLGRLLGSLGEAFWLLFPLWVGAGVLLGVLPRPRSPVHRSAVKIAIPIILVLFPAGFYLFLTLSLGGRIAWKEVLITIYFFAASLEVLLIYIFQGFENLAHRLARGRRRRAQILAAVGSRIALYTLLVPFLFATSSPWSATSSGICPARWRRGSRALRTASGGCRSGPGRGKSHRSHRLRR